MATWIEAHRSHSEQRLRWWLTEAGAVPLAELPAWLRREKAIAPSAESLALAGRLAQEGGYRIVVLVDPAYPRRICDALGEQAPPVLYCRGPLALFHLPASLRQCAELPRLPAHPRPGCGPALCHY